MKLSTYLLCERNRIVRKQEYIDKIRLTDTKRYAALDSYGRKEFRHEVVGRWASVTLVLDIQKMKSGIL